MNDKIKDEFKKKGIIILLVQHMALALFIIFMIMSCYHYYLEDLANTLLFLLFSIIMLICYANTSSALRSLHLYKGIYNLIDKR